jgi:phage shock protein A
MGLISRIFGLGKGKVARAIAEAESKDVDAVYRNALEAERKRAKEMNDLQRQTLGLVFQAQEKMEDLNHQLRQLQRDLEVAKSIQDMALGPVILEKIDALNGELSAAQEEHDTLQKEGEEISKASQVQEQAVEQLEKEWKSATSAIKADQVLKQIADRKKGLATDGASEALRNVQNKVSEARASRKASIAIDEQSLDNRLAKLRQQGSKTTAASRFEEMLKK